MTNFLHILSTFDAEIQINNQYIFELKSENQSPKILEINNIDAFNIQATPIHNKNTDILPIMAKIDLTKEKPTSCPFFEIYQLTNNNYYVKILTNQLEPSNPIYKGSFGKNTIAVYSKNITKIILESNSKFENVLINNLVDSAEIYLFNNVGFLQLFYKESLCNVVFINSINGEDLKCINATSFETTDSSVKILEECRGFNNHARITEFTIDENGSLQNKEYLAYLSPPKTAFSTEQLPFAFLEAINVKNYKLAKSFCSKNLKEKMQDAHLSNFFPENFEIIYYQIIPNVVYVKKDNQLKAYNFVIENNKINNIV